MRTYGLILFLWFLSCTVQGCTSCCIKEATSPVYGHDTHHFIESASKSTDGDLVLLLGGDLAKSGRETRYAIRVPLGVLRHDQPLDQRSADWLKKYRRAFYTVPEYGSAATPFYFREAEFSQAPTYADDYIAALSPDKLILDRKLIIDHWPQSPSSVINDSKIPIIQLQSPDGLYSLKSIPGNGERIVFVPGEDMVCAYIPATIDPSHPPTIIFILPRKTYPNFAVILWLPLTLLEDAGLGVAMGVEFIGEGAGMGLDYIWPQSLRGKPGKAR